MIKCPNVWLNVVQIESKLEKTDVVGIEEIMKEKTYTRDKCSDRIFPWRADADESKKI